MKINILSGRWTEHIEKRQFYLFLEILLDAVRKAELTELEYELSGIIATYDALLDYFNQGAEDTERDRVYRQLVGHALMIADRCTIATHAAKEMPYYTAQSRAARRESLHVYQLQLEAFGEGIRNTRGAEEMKQLAAAHDRQLNSLFTDLWTGGAWNAAMAAEVDKLLLSSTITEGDQCTIVSAVMLSLLRMFDPLKLLFLCDAYYHSKATVSTRALVGIVITCYCWADRIGYYSEVEARLSLLTDDPVFAAQVCDVILQFTRSADTEEINRKMREEIIPELMKNPKLRRMPGIMKEDSDDINPDWEQWMHESGLEESMREITEWQMEGADVNMSTFSQLKRYPFFYMICNWFRPFDVWQADMLGIVGNDSSSPIAKMILQSNFMCDSDKYSFCYAIREIPQMQRDAMMAQLEEQNTAMKENADIPDLKRMSRQTTQSLIRQYVQNLYRFFKLFPNVQEFDDPFQPFAYCISSDNPLCGCVTAESERLFKLIGLNIKRKDYWLAIGYFSLLEEWHPDCMEATQLQQLGLCYQKYGLHEEAIEAYVKADILHPDSYWTVLHLAQCYRAVSDNANALKYYEIAESLKPDNLSLTFHIAEILREEGEFEKALPRLHKIDYHHPESLKSVRLLAECNLFAHRYEQAAKYYERMMTEHVEELTDTDWRYAGYNYWMLGKRDSCFGCLLRADKLLEAMPCEEVEIDGVLYRDTHSLADEVLADFARLKSLGMRKEELHYLYDAYCRYKKLR
ncbi:MAG: hypothetical protein IKK87_05925 [Bacteroidaceae bacterium]|nr:hypothetical protein [Bacteroidaceae bacterium]